MLRIRGTEFVRALQPSTFSGGGGKKSAETIFFLGGESFQSQCVLFFHPSLSACRQCQSHGRSPEVQGFPPLPFAAIHCRQTTINTAVRRGEAALLAPLSSARDASLSHSELISIPPTPHQRADLGWKLFFFFYFCTSDPPYLGCSYCAFISPNNERAAVPRSAARGSLWW